jgi:hypothetical protein
MAQDDAVRKMGLSDRLDPAMMAVTRYKTSESGEAMVLADR